MRILIIEDEEGIIAALRRGLQKLYVLDVARNASDGMHLAEIDEYDLILIDLNLPDRNGIELCREIRATKIPTPIMIITGRSEIDDKVALLDVGADDYLTKPFSLEELKARMRALMRRNVSPHGSCITVGNLAIDVAARSVEYHGSPVVLRRKEFDLLEYMARNQEKTLTRQMILDHVWDMNDSLWTNVVDVHIKHLRDKIDRPYGVNHIRTVHGIGYKFQGEEKIASRKKDYADT
jgi:two-component system OmpR family response regulator